MSVYCSQKVSKEEVLTFANAIRSDGHIPRIKYNTVSIVLYLHEKAELRLQVLIENKRKIEKYILNKL